MKHSLAIFLQLLYNYYIEFLCNYPTTSYIDINNIDI